MNYVQIPEETAKILYRLAISSAAKVLGQDEAERAIVACGVLTQALSEAKPLPKKPGPKPKDDQSQCFAPIEVIDREEAEKRFPPKELMPLSDWKPEELPRHKVGDRIRQPDGTLIEVCRVKDNDHGGQDIAYAEVLE